VFTSLCFAYERLAPNVTNLGLAEANGEIYCAVNPVQGGKNIAAQPDFIAASQSLDLALGLYTAHPAAGSPLVSVSYPILSFDGQVQKLIFATFDTRWLETWQSKAALPEGAALTLLNPDGRPLWRSVSGENVPFNGEQAAEAEPLHAPQEGAAPSESPDLDGVIRLNITLPLNLGEQSAGFLHLGYPVAELYTQAYGELYWKLGLLGLVFSAALVLAWWGSETLFLQPLNNLLAAVARVQAGDLGARAGTVGGLGELTELAQSFDAMTDALQRREAERRQMEERASAPPSRVRRLARG
jgi:HAMP domain-containing protein